MPYKYIGRTTDFKGKTLWEIIGNLKNYGVGRYVIRNRLTRYPEPSYLKILKVETLACPEKQTVDNLRKVRVLVEKTFRGKKWPEPVLMESSTYKTDYRLIPKDEEANLLQQIEAKAPIVLPKTAEFPPLLKELLIREMKAKGEDATEPKLELVYTTTNLDKYRIAEDGETPTVQISTRMNSPNSSLYNNIKPIV